MRTFDYIIVGGGCSGLSLAMEIARARLDVRVAVIEARWEYTDDKTWCFWETEEHSHHDLISRRWNKWMVANSAGELECQSREFPYCRVKSIDFYKKALRSLEQRPGIRLLLGQRVLSLERRSPVSCIVRTETEEYSAPIVFDSRPLAQPSNHRKQHFVGWTVELERPAFQPDRVTLMDFRWNRGRELQFFYILPESSITALVETTYIGRETLPRSTYESDLKHFLGTYRTRYSVLREERGAIPLTTNTDAPPCVNIIHIGGRAGCIRASTGYGFISIQREAVQLARKIASNEFPSNEPVRPKWSNWMDQAFLRAIERSPSHASEMFYQLFFKTHPESLVRFLNDCPHWSDALRVIWATPKMQMLRAAMP